MFGNYRISQGIYKFSLQEDDSQRFYHQRWKYDYFQRCSFGCEYGYSSFIHGEFRFIERLEYRMFRPLPSRLNVRVNCIMNLSGILLRPTIKLGIEASE